MSDIAGLMVTRKKNKSVLGGQTQKRFIKIILDK